MRTLKMGLFFCAFILILASCDDQESKAPNTPAAICPPQYLQSPLFISPPEMGFVDTLTPTLVWSFPTVAYTYEDMTTCQPEKFRVVVFEGPYFQEQIETEIDGSQTSWTTPTLKSGKEYQWSVIPVTNDIEGPSSGTRTFFTGENCTGDVSAPTLLQPFNSGEIFYLNPTFTWKNNSLCTPYPWHIDVATDADFNNPFLNITLDSPSTLYSLAAPLENCTDYYWRIVASYGTDIETYSETFHFRTAAEGCEQIPETAGIAGWVWRDICILPENEPYVSPLPFGCQMVGGDKIADGEWQEGEPGIDNVIIHIGLGTCENNIPLGTTLTSNGGYFVFAGLPQGDYCISADADENPVSLGYGWWTLPLQHLIGTVAQSNLSITQEEVGGTLMESFGWQAMDEDLPPFGIFKGKVFVDKCSVDPGDSYSEPLPDGCTKHWQAPDGENVWANGYLEDGEEGIAELYVVALEGGCNGPYYAHSFTDEEGNFDFILPQYQDFCIKLYSNIEPNQSLLGSGIWSDKWDQPIYEIDFQLENDSAVFEEENSTFSTTERLNFGWDPSFDIGDISHAVDFPIYEVGNNQTNCREWPYLSARIMSKLLSGMRFEIKGMNFDRDWFYIVPINALNMNDFGEHPKYYEDVRCWVMGATGSTEGDLDGVEVREVPDEPINEPEPTEEPVIDCSSFRSKTSCQSNGCTWKEIFGPFGGLGECQ